MSGWKEITMDNFANGVASELFQYELNKVLDNVQDLNTKPDGLRTITMTFSIKPDAERETAQLVCSAKAKLMPVKPSAGQMYFAKKGGKLKAYAHDINQEELNLESKPELVHSKREA